MEVTTNCMEKEEAKGEDEILKRRISSHPSYRLLVEAHLGCLKVGDIGELGRDQIRDHQKQQEHDPASFSSMGSRSELDHFMEAYCLALRKLKEAMEEPQQKSMAFINSMHSELEELASTELAPSEPATANSPAE